MKYNLYVYEETYENTSPACRHLDLVYGKKTPHLLKSFDTVNEAIKFIKKMGNLGKLTEFTGYTYGDELSPEGKIYRISEVDFRDLGTGWPVNIAAICLRHPTIFYIEQRLIT